MGLPECVYPFHAHQEFVAHIGACRLWTELGDGEICHIADFAARHFERTGRPLRVAVDEPGWRYKNLTTQQAYKIRQDTVQAANPIEKLILYRILKLLRYNIQFLFVFDGPQRPRGKRGKHGGGGVIWKEIKQLKDLLKQLGVAQHMAPGEAEAECAALQAEGIVDAVWSEDCDCLMFGCTTLIRDYRENGKKSETKVRVYRSQILKDRFQLDREGLVGFAVLNGGDYDTKGLKGCGPKLAMQAVRQGFGKSLCVAFDNCLGFGQWRTELVDFLRAQHKYRDVPYDFPNQKNVENYYRPVVSRPGQLSNLNSLRNGWNLKVVEAELREHLRDHYNFFTKEYMKHITPVLVARSLIRAGSGNRELCERFDLQPSKRSKKETEEAADGARKVSFIAASATEIDVDDSIAKDLTMERQKRGPPYDPEQRIECELLDVVLKRALPDRDFSAPLIQKRKTSEKSSIAAGDVDSSVATQSRKRKSAATDAEVIGEIERLPKKAKGRPKKADKPNSAFDVGIDNLCQDEEQASILMRTSSPELDLPDVDTLLRHTTTFLTAEAKPKAKCVNSIQERPVSTQPSGHSAFQSTRIAPRKANILSELDLNVCRGESDAFLQARRHWQVKSGSANSNAKSGFSIDVNEVIDLTDA
ncbi:MAG: hypothetical protein M1820_002666 [Bogoriella megaspora]|nr:MAG: hypothetical protein M1820_002666 [Bogoriella megaspora]